MSVVEGKKKKILLLAVVVIPLLFYILFYKRKEAELLINEVMGIKPRGIRNNNPLNIAYFKNLNYIGLVGGDTKNYSGGNDSNMCVFDTMQHGIKAAFSLAAHMIGQGYNTPAKLLGRWMNGPNENTIISDVVFNVNKKGDYAITKDTPLGNNDKDIIAHILWAQSKWEVGAKWQPPLSLFMDEV